MSRKSSVNSQLDKSLFSAPINQVNTPSAFTKKREILDILRNKSKDRLLEKMNSKPDNTYSEYQDNLISCDSKAKSSLDYVDSI